MPLSTITAGACVIYQGDQYEVRSVDGNVLELVYDTGRFFRFVHVSSVTGCLPPAISTAASLPAPAAGQGAGISSVLQPSIAVTPSCAPFAVTAGQGRCNTDLVGWFV